jgi:hypothetical protein
MMNSVTTKCKICDFDLEIFHTQHNVPVNSVIRLASKKEALTYPRGDIELGFCNRCGFIQNSAFDEDLVTYSSEYNPTQSHSGTFNRFHIELAETLINRYDINNKTVVEIGCGQGEFLDIITDYGDNKGIGFDPACNRQSIDSITFIKDFYSEKYSKYQGDFICCKMTLEHISSVKQFLELTKYAIKDEDTVVFFQVPDTYRILMQRAFWDIYYEHCSYFTKESLSSLFQRTGFEILDLWDGFDKQYLMITAKLGKKTITPNFNALETKKGVIRFKEQMAESIPFWNKFLKENKNTVLWGGGSKAVAFLTSTKNNIEYVVDIDPLKYDTYIAGTGQKIVSPLSLKKIRPDHIIIMNPVYETEIQKKLLELELDIEILRIK